MKKVLIGITTAETVCHETMESLFNMIRPDDVQVTLRIIHAYQVSNGRNELALYALQNGFDYLFFVDSDVIIPEFALEKLLAANTLVINGTYPRKELNTITKDNPYTTLYRHDRRGLNAINFGPFFMSQNELPKEGVVPVDAAGLGCTLIHTDVFRIIGGNDWFHFAQEPAKINFGPYCIGEDLYFYRECLRHNIQPYAEGSVRCGHVGKFIYKLKQ